MDTSVMFSLTYGLFVVTAREGDKDNGCITNTAAQVTDTPLRISLTVNKANYTHHHDASCEGSGADSGKRSGLPERADEGGAQRQRICKNG